MPPTCTLQTEKEVDVPIEEAEEEASSDDDKEEAGDDKDDDGERGACTPSSTPAF